MILFSLSFRVFIFGRAQKEHTRSVEVQTTKGKEKCTGGAVYTRVASQPTNQPASSLLAVIVVAVPVPAVAGRSPRPRSPTIRVGLSLDPYLFSSYPSTRIEIETWSAACLCPSRAPCICPSPWLCLCGLASESESESATANESEPVSY